MSPADAPPKLGEWLLGQGLISHDQLRIALTEQQTSGLSLGQQLVALGFVTEAALHGVLARAAGEASVDLAQVVADPEAVQLMPEALARRHQCLPLAVDFEHRLFTVAMADPHDLAALDQLRAHLQGRFEIRPVRAAQAQISECLDRFYGFDLSVDGILREIETGEVDHPSVQSAGGEYTQPVVRLVNALLADAVKRGASDIHFEPEAGFLRIRLRIDGVLEHARSLHRRHWTAIAVRLKIIAGLNIAETRAPQDGRLTLTLYGRPIDFRVSVLPTLHGENIVLRVLDREKAIIPLERMGLAPDTLLRLKHAIARPEGMLIVTGPTGSGKTTTLYSLLSHLNREDVNIMTLEDPVEYPLPLIRQTSVSETVKVDFANGIRAILRQDPDIILVGEMRDRETAEMAFRAAMTGHRVLSTLHTQSALGVFPRLLDMGLSPGILAGNIIAVVAQRLVRRLCPHCREAYTPNAAERLWLNDDDAILYRPVGCVHCAYKGYRGRLALMEFLEMDAALDEAIARGAPQRELAALAAARGMRSLAADGIRRARAGETSLAEVARVVDLDRGLVRADGH